MRMMKTWLCGILSVILLLGMLPAAALAVEGEPDGGTPAVCTGEEDCPADIHEEGCPLSEVPRPAAAPAKEGELDETVVTRAVLAEKVHQAILPDAAGGDQGFTDLDENCTKSQKAAINALAAAGIISGTSEDAFDPAGSVTRAQTAVVLWRAAGCKSGGSQAVSFTDVFATDWFAPAVAALASAGVINGNADGSFGPNGNISVGELEGLLSNYASAGFGDEEGATRLEMLMEAYEKYKDSPLATVTAKEIDYDDIFACTPEEQKAIQFFTSRGIVSGYNPTNNNGKNLFAPDAPASNLQATMFLYRCATKFAPETVEGQDLREDGGTMSASAVHYKPLPIPDNSTEMVEAAWAFLKEQIGAEAAGEYEDNPDALIVRNTVADLTEKLAPGIPEISIDGNGTATITATDEAAAIYYTTNGDDPTIKSTRYGDQGVTIPYDAAIKAVAVKNGLYSEVATARYVKTYPVTIIGPTGTMQNSPVIELDEEGAVARIQGSGNTLFDPKSNPDSSVQNQLTYWVYNGWTFTAVKDGQTESFGPVKVIDDGLKNFLNEKIRDSWTLTMDSKTPGYYDYPSSGGSSGSSSGSGNTATETTRNPDGSTTTVTTDKNSGAVTKTVKTPDGVTGTVVTDKRGNVTEASASVSASAAREAERTGGAVTLPLEVPAAKSSEAAPVVEIAVPRSVDRVKVEIPVERVTPGAVAVIVRADGTEEIVKTSIPTGDGVALTLEESAEVKIIDNSREFADVHGVDHWAADAIDFTTSRELFSGTGDRTFTPDSPMTRAMLMTVLARLDGEELTGSGVFERAMAWAVAGGVSDGSNPNGAITREQMAVMLYRYAGCPAGSGSLYHFADADSVSGYAAQAMRWAVEQGLIGGMGDGTLAPRGRATRAQVAAVLMRFCQSLAG